MKNIQKAIPLVAIIILIIININQNDQLRLIQNQINSTIFQFNQLDSSINNISTQISALNDQEKRIMEFAYETSAIDLAEATANVDIKLKLNGVSHNSDVKLKVYGKPFNKKVDNEVFTINNKGDVFSEYESFETAKPVPGSIEEFELQLAKEDIGVYRGSFVGNYNQSYIIDVVIDTEGIIYQEKVKNLYLYDETRIHFIAHMWNPSISKDEITLSLNLDYIENKSGTEIKEYMLIVNKDDTEILSYDILNSADSKLLDKDNIDYSLTQSIPFEVNKTYTVILVLVDEYNRRQEQYWTINTIE